MYLGRESEVAGKAPPKFAPRAKRGCKTRNFVATFLFPRCIYDFFSCRGEKDVLPFSLAGENYVLLASGEKNIIFYFLEYFKFKYKKNCCRS